MSETIGSHFGHFEQKRTTLKTNLAGSRHVRTPVGWENTYVPPPPISEDDKRIPVYDVGQELSRKTGRVIFDDERVFGRFIEDRRNEHGQVVDGYGVIATEGESVEIHLYGHLTREQMQDRYGKEVNFVYGTSGLVSNGRETIVRRQNSQRILDQQRERQDRGSQHNTVLYINPRQDSKRSIAAD